MLRDLRELDFGAVHGVPDRVRVQHSDELDRLLELSNTSAWFAYAHRSAPELVIWFGPDGQSVERVQGAYARAERAKPLRAARTRRDAAAALRQLMAEGIVSAVEAVERAGHAAATDSHQAALEELAASDRWQTGRERWWGREALTLEFEADALREITIERVLFLH